jgi:hypothetical protein
MSALSPNIRCQSCAFGPQRSSVTAHEPDNVLRGTIAALGGVPFRCHHAPDGRELNWRGGPVEFLKSMDGRRDYRICAGWKSKVRQLAKRGHFNKRKSILHALGQYAMERLDDFLGSKKRSVKDWAFKEMKSTVALIRRIGRKDRKAVTA